MLDYYGMSDPGCVRSNNEDYYLLAPSLGLYVVADGMGGAQAGEHASKLAADTVAECIWKVGQANADILELAVVEANRRVVEASTSDPSLQGMGTTLVAVLENGEEVDIVSVGDSRAYLFQDHHLHVVTEDQTWVNEVGRRLGLDEEVLRTHPMRHVLTMAVGAAADLRINRYVVRLQQDTQLLLCSDGLHGVVSEEAIAKVLETSETFEDKCRGLVQAAREASGPDNITAVLLGPAGANSRASSNGNLT